MPKYVIEREIPGAGKLTAEELKGISQKSCGVLQEMGPRIQWQESYVTDDKIYCVYIAANVLLTALKEPPMCGLMEPLLSDQFRGLGGSLS